MNISKNNNIFNKVLIAAFIAFPLAFLAVIFITEDNPISVNENRVLTTRESIRSEIFGGEFQSDLENYLSDQFPIRDRLKSAEVNVRLALRSGSIGDAYVGEDGRLFQKLLSSDVDSEKCVKYAARVNRIAEQTGIETYVMYVPSAGISLKDYMPKGAPMYDCDSLYTSLKSELKSCKIIDLRKSLSGHPEYYYATDHHWTVEGVSAAYREWRKAHGDKDTETNQPEVFTVSKNFRGTLWSKVPSGKIRCDEIQAFKIPDELTVEADGREIGLYDYSALKTKDKYNFFQGGNHGILTVANPNAKSGKTLLVLKDSFANSFLPCIADDYAKIIMIDERYAFIDAGQLALDSGADEIALIREIISTG